MELVVAIIIVSILGLTIFANVLNMGDGKNVGANFLSALLSSGLIALLAVFGAKF